MILEDIVNLIELRNHLEKALNGVGGGITSANKKDVGKQISKLDEKIIKHSLALDLEKFDKEQDTIAKYINNSPPLFPSLILKDQNATATSVSTSGTLSFTSTEFDKEQWGQMIKEKETKIQDSSLNSSEELPKTKKGKFSRVVE